MEELESSLKVDSKFIEENKKLKFTNSKKGGRYSKAEKDKRQKEVHRLHFEYGYSGRKISDIMKISRNTINNDIDYWYTRIFRKTNVFNPESAIVLNVERLEIQRTRIREQLDKAESFQEKMSAERMLYEIDCKILYTYHRLTESQRKLVDYSTERINNWLKENKEKTRYLTVFDKMLISNKTRNKIEKVIKENEIGPHHI